MESRIHGDVYVRFGGEYVETCRLKGRQGATCLACERVDDEIFFYTSDSDLQLIDNELVAILKESNPEWFD